MTDAKSASYVCSEAFIRTLLRTKAESFAIEGPPDSTPIFTCSLKDRIVDVWQGLVAHNFLAVPVTDEAKRCMGFLDLVDIIRYVVAHFGERYIGQAADFWDLVKEENKFQQKTVQDIVAPALESSSASYVPLKRNPFTPIVRGYSAWTLFELLARDQLHRVPVIDRESGQLYNLVTQSQVLSWLKQRLDTLGSVKDKPLSEFINPVFKTVVKVREDQQAISAFDMLVREGVSGVAVVDAEGKLTGALSARDLKVISTDARLFWRLHQHVRDFVRKLRAEYQEKHGRPPRVLYALSNATLAQVITELTDNRVHRLFVIDNVHNKNPIGVVSLTDILKEIADSC